MTVGYLGREVVLMTGQELYDFLILCSNLSSLVVNTASLALLVYEIFFKKK